MQIEFVLPDGKKLRHEVDVIVANGLPVWPVAAAHRSAAQSGLAAGMSNEVADLEADYNVICNVATVTLPAVPRGPGSRCLEA